MRRTAPLTRGVRHLLRNLSSELTWLYKFAFPTVWICGFGPGTLALFLVSEDARDPELLEVRWFFLGVLLVGTAMIYWSLIRLKKVSLVGDEFVISNYRKAIRVKILDVDKVTGSVLCNPELAWLHFRVTTDFGMSAQFMLPMRFSLNPFSRHPIVEELNLLIRGNTCEVPGCQGHRLPLTKSRSP